VINIGSIDGMRVAATEMFPYAASKAGVHHLTKAFALSLAPTITANVIAPGAFTSTMFLSSIAEVGVTTEQVAAATPMSRVGCTDDIAGTIIYLSSKAGSWLTGAVIPVDGGLSMIN